MEKEPRPTNLKKPSVYPRYKSMRWICDYDEIVEGKVKNRRPSFKTKKDAEKKLKEIEAKQRRAIRKSES
ncbi:hypothetical protein QEH56_21415 [Pelagicoccus enzymogenes]|uniref:Arm DNA-binding domain-containing protein n=1 Tax=Pelagicoccus enzymogenes TaxID=2773457 RepID=UPI00280D6B3D|nr:Arm DNA-binding domain-containing protein [Pelagicoccus enzymogenes]MDQ8200741.1 hypothetical protein [Pelagicoccus enzymogenes]